MKKKHDFSKLVVRTVEKINQEYSELIVKLGTLELEVYNIEDAQDKMDTNSALMAKRAEEIKELKKECRDKVEELSHEMDLAQKEKQRKVDLEKEKNPELSMNGTKHFVQEDSGVSP